jgi:hypothetical protein
VFVKLQVVLKFSLLLVYVKLVKVVDIAKLSAVTEWLVLPLAYLLAISVEMLVVTLLLTVIVRVMSTTLRLQTSVEMLML